MQKNNYQLLIEKLDEFIRKYYKNQLIRGVLYSVAIGFIFYLAVVILEYFAHFDVLIRSILFYTFIFANVYILVRWVSIPVLKLYKLGKIISYEQAAIIIGNHFGEVKDKLLNVLQLQQQSLVANTILVEASIEQKINLLRPIPFSAAVDFGENKKYITYAAFPLLIFLILLFSAPAVIKQGTWRMVEHQTFFAKQAPFQFVINNNSLTAIQQQDFQLNVKLTGNNVPQDVFINIGENQYKLTKENTVLFNYIFKSVQSSITFQLSADGFQSQEYHLKVLPNPVLLDFEISLNYPKYTGKKDEVLKNTGDLVVPQGTKISWKFNTKNTNALVLHFGDSSVIVKQCNENQFVYGTRLMSSKNYSIRTSNEFMKNKDSIGYSINVIPDLYPTIQVQEKTDSMDSKKYFFNGAIRDDYGFTKLTFNYRFLANDSSANGKKNNLQIVSIPVNKTLTQDRFYYFWEMDSLNIQPGDQLEYYFEVWDNDEVNGAKSTRSEKMIFKAPTLEEIAQNTEKNNTNIKNNMQQAINEAQQMQQQLSNTSEDIFQKKNLDWQEKKKIQDLLNHQQELQKKVDDLQKQNAQKDQQQSEFKKEDQKIADEQQQLQKLFEQVMPEEMKKKLAELQKLLNEMDKDKVQQELQKMSMNNKDLQKELERTLELFKQMEVQQKLSDAIDKLKDLSQKQQGLADKTKEKSNKSDNQAVKDQQKKLNQQFDDFKKDMQDLAKKNSELENPNTLPNTEKQQQDIKDQMSKSSEQLQNNKNSKASESQQNASKQMNQLSQQMAQMQLQMQQQAQTEDIAALRAILDNLIQLSFDQEALMNKIGKTSTDNPQYMKIAEDQKNLQDNTKTIEDSLFALSKRAPQINGIVNREIASINMNMTKSIDAMAKRETFAAAERQQYSMTSINNLALLLDESLQQMQKDQKKNQMQGEGSCSKPGGKSPKPSMAQMRSMQQQLNEQIQALQQAMKKGGKKDGKSGKGGKNGQSGFSEQLVKLAAQQAAIREAMQQGESEMDPTGKQAGQMSEMEKEMNKTETDLVNKMLSEETVKRQQAILTRMLESEKAEKEQKWDNKRDAITAKQQLFANPPIGFLQFNTQKIQEQELLKTVPPSLTPFYKTKVNEYFNNIQSN
ncbi:MAG: DUF4175 family protein [Bacteroidia bacterium]